MGEIIDWLSLKVSHNTKSTGQSQQASTLILIPKRIVRLATRRNRIRRLIREAIRKEILPEADKIYCFRVTKDPADPGLEGAHRAVKYLLRIG